MYDCVVQSWWVNLVNLGLDFFFFWVRYLYVIYLWTTYFLCICVPVEVVVYSARWIVELKGSVESSLLSLALMMFYWGTGMLNELSHHSSIWINAIDSIIQSIPSTKDHQLSTPTTEIHLSLQVHHQAGGVRAAISLTSSKALGRGVGLGLGVWWPPKKFLGSPRGVTCNPVLRPSEGLEGRIRGFALPSHPPVRAKRSS